MPISYFIILLLVLESIFTHKCFAQNLNINPFVPNYKIESYNTVPGKQELNLFNIEIARQINSTGILCPDGSKAAYSEVYYYPENMQTSSKIFYFFTKLNIDKDNAEFNLSKSDAERIINPKSPINRPFKILESGVNTLNDQLFNTLTIVDWSYDGNKLLVKEKVGEHYRGIISTNLWVYDFNLKTSKRLDQIRKTVVYYWKTLHKLALNDYRWDIEPLGWDINYPDRIIVNAYGYNYDEKHFLGCWAVDYSTGRTRLLSLENENWPVGKYGKIIKSGSVLGVKS